jgi:hypothetical protein
MMLVCWGYTYWKLDRKIFPAFASAGLVFLLLLPNTLRSWSILGFPAPFGSGYIARIMHAGETKHTRFHWNGGTWIYSSPSCYIEPLEPLSHWMIGRAYNETIQDITISKESGRAGWNIALRKITPSIESKLLHLGENIVLFLFAPSWPDSGKDDWIGALNYCSRWIWAAIIFHLVVGNAFCLKKRAFNLVPALGTVCILLFLFQNRVTMEGRYRKPIEPLLLLNLVWLWSVNRESAEMRTLKVRQ